MAIWSTNKREEGYLLHYRPKICKNAIVALNKGGGAFIIKNRSIFTTLRVSPRRPQPWLQGNDPTFFITQDKSLTPFSPKFRISSRITVFQRFLSTPSSQQSTKDMKTLKFRETFHILRKIDILKNEILMKKTHVPPKQKYLIFFKN